MEIIHVLMGRINPARMSGAGRLINELAVQQVNTGARVSLWGITRFANHDYPGTLYDTFLFKSHGNGRKLCKRLLMAVHAKRYNTVFHLHGGFNPAFCSLAKLLHELDIPFVFSPHGSYDQSALQKDRLRKYFYLRFYEKKIWQYADTIHCLGKKEADQVQKLFPNKKTVLIRYGYQETVQKGLVRPMQDSQSLPAKYFIVGYCGQLDIHAKGLDALLKGFALFQKQVGSARLWIIGNGRQKAKLEKMASELGILRKIVFKDTNYSDERPALLSQLQVLTQPSRYEDLPATVLEAASLGIPSLVTQATNLGEAVRLYECGEVINTPDPAAISVALFKLYTRIQSDEQGSISDNARKMVREEFSWNNVIHSFERLYETA